MHTQVLLSSEKSRLFSAVPHNSKTLNTVTMAMLCEGVPDFDVILQGLKNRGFFRDVEPVALSLSDVLQGWIKNHERLLATPHALVHESVVYPSVVSALDLPNEFSVFQDQIQLYIQLICDVLSNTLADKNYEPGLPNTENVSEREHALQAGKIAYLFGLDSSDVLAMLLHDISRPTHEDQVYGNKNHCDEGSAILAPLGFSIDYCRYHAFAKYLLNEFNPTYKNKLLSPVSQVSLEEQKAKMHDQLQDLSSLATIELAALLYKIIYMRLVDDFSKVPTCGMVIDYFSDEYLKMLLSRQFSLHLTKLSSTREELSSMLDDFSKKLESALVLLQRPKEFSKHLELYASHAYPKHRCGASE